MKKKKSFNNESSEELTQASYFFREGEGRCRKDRNKLKACGHSELSGSNAENQAAGLAEVS